MRRPQILLVNPWIHDFAAYDMWARPMGLLILANKLRHEGWECRLIDCLDQDHPGMQRTAMKPYAHGRFPKRAIPRPSALNHVRRTFSRYGVDPELIRAELQTVPAPNVILVTCLMTYWYTGVKETIGLLREYFPGVPILLGGVYASLTPDHALENSGADEIITGPGEWALPRVLFRLTGKHAQVEPDESLGFTPALDLVRRVRFLPILTARGCPFRCSYCASGRLLPVFLRRQPASVVSEIEEGRLRYGVSDIALYDDAFLMDAPRHAIPLLEAVIEKVPGLRWHTPNGLHASAIDGRVASLMKKAGFETIRIGLESSSDQFHAHTGGKTDMSSFLAAVQHLKEAGFSKNQIGVYLLVGLPGQSRAQIEDDVDRVLQAGAVPKLAEYSPIPGTGMWPEAMRRSRFPIDAEPLFQNCTLLPAAEPDVDWDFLRTTRRRIREYTYKE